MYDNLQTNYRVIFEGQPAPIFYKYFYPTGNNHDVLWDLFNYARGLKKDKPRDNEQYEVYSNMTDTSNGSDVNLYEYDLRQFLNAVYADTGRTRNAGITAIPSSNASKVNRVTELIRSIMQSTPGVYTDLTRNIHRRKSKDAAHGGGDRSIEANISTLGAKRPDEIRNLDLVIVVDDIVTSGNSFRAMTEFLRRLGFRGQIVNFAFARHFPSEVVEEYLAHDHSVEYEAFSEIQALRRSYDKRPEENNEGEPIFGVIYDLDQTLLNDSVRDFNFEENLWRGTSSLPYEFFNGIKELMELPLPVAIVSNRPESQLDNLFDLYEFEVNIPFPEWPREGLLRPVFSFPEERRGDFTTRYYKPHPAGVNQALFHLCQDYDLLGCRIVGVGNTIEDIIAYKACGLEAVLALWGVPEWLKNTARSSWQADFIFDRVDDFRQWLEARMEKPDYYEMGRQAESHDKRQACAYYDKALQYGTNVCSAAFNYAHLISAERPSKAKELYQLAIDAGDEYGATNNLALLIEDDNPEQAITLFERAMAAGNIGIAARNLAILLKEDDPERAIGLLRQAADAGNGGNLAADLKPFIIAGRESAIQLYKDAIVEKDGKKAYDLGCLLYEAKPEMAMELFKHAIDAGDERNATFGLAVMLANTDQEQAIELYEKAIAAGERKNSPNNLANIIKENDPERAIALYEMAIQAGDDYFAPRNLANMIKAQSPERAIKLFATAAKAGNTAGLYDDLEPLIRNGNEAAIDLCEHEIATHDADKANSLGVLIQSSFPSRAKRLFELALDAGDKRYAASNLANMIENTDPTRAEQLYRQSIEAGNDDFAPRKLGLLICDTRTEEAESLLRAVYGKHPKSEVLNELGIVVAYRDLTEAKDLFQRAMDEGEDWAAPCNLAHLLLATDSKRARELYEGVLKYDELEAWCGLAYIFREDDQAKASEYLQKLRELPSSKTSIEFFLDFVALADKKTANKAGVFFADKGYEWIRQNILKQSFGSSYDPWSNMVEYGRAPSGSTNLRWHVLQLFEDRVFLLSENILGTMAYVEDAANADWSGSAIRRWLNDEFVRTAFESTEEGAARILRINEDLVTCLTPEEYESFSSGATGNRNTFLQTRTTWWLKATGNDTMSAPYVRGSKVNWGFSRVKDGIRPALWLKLESGE